MKKSKIVRAYKADMDGFYSNVVETMIEKSYIDNQHTYFKTFNAAKKHVMAQLKDMIAQYKNNLAEIKALKVEDLINGSI